MNSYKGFTLIELIIVIAVIAVMAGFVVFQFRGPQDEAQNTQRKSDIRQYQTALEVYANSNNGNYPDGADDMATICGANLTSYASQCPDDPEAATWMSYKYSGTATSYVIWDKLEKTNEFYVVCSNGAVGSQPESWGGPSAQGVCPL